MESWKARRFCETATLEQLRARIAQLEESLAQGRVDKNDAEYFLRLANEVLELRSAFESESVCIGGQVAENSVNLRIGAIQG